MLIKLSPSQEAQLMAWAQRHGSAEVDADCEPTGYDLSIAVTSTGVQAEARWGSDTLDLGEVEIEVRSQPEPTHMRANPEMGGKASQLIEMLKRFNAKERNFLMRYALCGISSPTLSPLFVNDLVERLKDIGVPRLEGAEAVYFGMDYHLEWIHAALLLANGDLPFSDGVSERREGVLERRIEDVDLLVVLQRPDASVVLVLIEAKGVTSFSTGQLGSKLERLTELWKATGKESEWLESVMLLMSPQASSPHLSTLEKFVKELIPVGFWPGNAAAKFLWMELKHFFADIGGQQNALRIGTCYADGTCASDIAARSAKQYTHWYVTPRSFAKGKTAE